MPYGLYRAEISYSATRGVKTGVDTRNFELLHRTLEMMFDHDHDRTASRGALCTRGLYAFGNAPAHKLTERVQVTRATAQTEPARRFEDYTVAVNDDALPRGVTLTELSS